MKIGLVVDDTLDKTDGVQQYVLTLGAWLKSQGHRVHYLVGETKRTDIKNVHSLGRNLKVQFNQNVLSIPFRSDTKRIKQLLETQRFDVLHVQMPYNPLLAGKIIKHASPRTAVVGTFHILPFSIFEQIATNALGLLVYRTLRRFDAICSVSEAARIFATTAFRIHSEVIPNAINISQFKTPKPTKTDKVRIVFLGRLVARKGCLELLQAITMLPQYVQRQIVVTIGGRGPQLKQLEQFVYENDLGDIVSFEGFISEADKPAFLAAADIAVFPSLSGESFGIVLLEAMASGSGVVLGGDNPGYRCVLGEMPELLVNPLHPQAFANELKELITDVEHRQILRKWQRKHVKQFDINIVGEQILELYQTAIAKRPRS